MKAAADKMGNLPQAVLDKNLRAPFSPIIKVKPPEEPPTSTSQAT